MNVYVLVRYKPNICSFDWQYEKDQKRRNPAYFAENTHDHAGFQRAFRQHARQLEMEDRKQGGRFVGEVAISTGGRNLRSLFALLWRIIMTD